MSEDPRKEPVVKTEPTAPSSSAPAARGKPSARTFVPNLGVRRAEVKAEPQSEPVKEEKKQRGRIQPNLSARGGRGGRGARNQANLIQSHSIFEAGPAESDKRFGNERNSAESHSKVVGISTGGGSGVKREPTEGGLIKVDYGLFTDDLKEDKDTVYIQLKNENKEVDMKVETETKTERRDKQILRDLLNNPNEEDAQKEKLIILQLPENLDLMTLGEGHVGKIRVYKSGKIVLCLNGDTSLNVSLSVSGPFLQDAVALEKSAESLSEATDPVKMLNLGHVDNKIVCSPRLF